MKKFIIFFILVLITACSNMSQETLEEAASKANENFKLSKKEQKIIDASNDFSIKLFKELEKSQADSSLMLSPMGVIYGLNILNNGASGVTQDQLCKLLGYPKNDLDTVNALCRRMMIGQYLKKKMNSEGGADDYMKSSNLFVIDKALGMKNDLSPIIKGDYFSDMMAVDMANDAQKKINQWCYQQTDSAIKDIPLDLDKNTSACLINTTIFNAAWLQSLSVGEPEKELFYKQNGEKVMLPMMGLYDREHLFRGFKNALFSALRLRYCGQFSMTILLPNKGKTVADIIDSLSSKKVREMGHYLKKYDVMDILMPKFTIKSDLKISQSLKRLGLKELFSDKAQLTGFTTQPIGVNDLIQKSELIVDEKGTYIKSVTEYGFITLGLTPTPTVFEFSADHPFLFMITDYFGNICFIGQYQGN